MYTQKVIVLDSKTYSIVKIHHSRCLHQIEEEKEGTYLPTRTFTVINLLRTYCLVSKYF